MEAWFLLIVQQNYYHPAVHDHTKRATPALNIAASWGDGGHFPPFVGAMRRIHLGAALRSFQFKWDSSSSSIAVGLDFFASVFPWFVWEDSFLSVSVPNCRVNDGCCHRLRPITLEEPRRVVSWTQTRELRPNDRFKIVAVFILLLI